MVPKSKVIEFSADSPKSVSFDCLTAVAFARSIGLRQKGAFVAFIQDGHSPATQVEHPNTNQLTYIMTDEDVDAFKARFTTITILSTESGLHRNTIRHALKIAGIHPLHKTVGTMVEFICVRMLFRLFLKSKKIQNLETTGYCEQRFFHTDHGQCAQMP